MTCRRRSAAADRAARIKELFDQGLDDAAIAAAVGTDRDTVRATRSRMGWLLDPAEVKRRRQEAAKATSETLMAGSISGDYVKPAPDVSHLYRGRRYDAAPGVAGG